MKLGEEKQRVSMYSDFSFVATDSYDDPAVLMQTYLRKHGSITYIAVPDGDDGVLVVSHLWTDPGLRCTPEVPEDYTFMSVVGWQSKVWALTFGGPDDCYYLLEILEAGIQVDDIYFEIEGDDGLPRGDAAYGSARVYNDPEDPIWVDDLRGAVQEELNKPLSDEKVEPLTITETVITGVWLPTGKPYCMVEFIIHVK